VKTDLPAGVVGHDACTGFLIPKKEIALQPMHAALRQHMGYENLSPSSDLFTLGIDMRDDDELTRREATGIN
jgi:hypothetical protein